MLQSEPLFDKCIPLFVAHMDKRAGTAIDFGEWLSWSVLLQPLKVMGADLPLGFRLI
jgi:hypothetical protein